jgi:hypothetical protein
MTNLKPWSILQNQKLNISALVTFSLRQKSCSRRRAYQDHSGEQQLLLCPGYFFETVKQQQPIWQRADSCRSEH